MANSVSEDVEPTGTKYGSYKRVEVDLRGRISRGEWSAGSLLPRRRDLAREYEIDVNTLQRAILPLVADGTLRVEGKRGTFVSTHSDRIVTAVLPELDGEIDIHGSAKHSLKGPQPLTNITLGLIAELASGQSLGTDSAATHTRDTIRAIEAACYGAGGQTRLFNTYLAGGTGCGVNEAAAILLAEGVNALVVLDIYDNPEVVAELCSIELAEAFPLVYISSAGNFAPHLHIFYDQRHAGYVAARHLLERGWSNVTFIAPYRAGWLEDRIAGARVAVERSSAPDCSFKVAPARRAPEQYDPNVNQATLQAIRDVLSQDGFGGGIIAPNDSAARLIIEEANRAGLVIGQHYALAAFDDDIESSSLGLTSVRPPLEEMGAAAVRLVTRRLAGEAVNLHMCLRSHLAARASTAARR